MAAARKRVGVIGDPVAHSISPAMHQPALDALGIAATYERWQTPVEELPERIASLRSPDAIGANVTVPHKIAVMAMLDDVSPLAQRAGAVNTVVNRGGRLVGDNTDVHGFAVALIAACPDSPKRRALILGAGGAARAVVLALESAGAGDIALANRDRRRALRLAADLAPTTLRVVGPGTEALDRELQACTLLINATSLGWKAGETPVPLGLLALLPPGALVVDLTYRDTDLLLAARGRGLATLDGLPMLVHQGARALELWTNQKAPVDIMMRAAQEARAGRT